MIRKLAAVALFSAFALPATSHAQQCEVTVSGNDALQFDVKDIVVDKSCKEFKVVLKHVGKLPASAMGHNWVLTREADMQAVATEGMAAGLGKDYVRSEDPRVLAYTKVIGGGEETSVTFDTAKLEAGQPYLFFCSFPGHSGIMKGTLKLGA